MVFNEGLFGVLAWSAESSEVVGSGVHVVVQRVNGSCDSAAHERVHFSVFALVHLGHCVVEEVAR